MDFWCIFLDFRAEHHSTGQIIKPIHGIHQWDVRETPHTPSELWGSCRTKAGLQFVLMMETLKCWAVLCLRMSLLSPLWPHLTAAAMFLFVHLMCLLIQLPGGMTTLPPPPLFTTPLSIYSWNWWFNEELGHHEWPLCYCFSLCVLVSFKFRRL